jgi:hypothetical protein
VAAGGSAIGVAGVQLGGPQLNGVASGNEVASGSDRLNGYIDVLSLR